MSIQDLVGKEFSPFAMPVERGKIREFANAIGDDNPIYSDPVYAGKSGFGDIPAPPTFTAVKGRSSGSSWKDLPIIWKRRFPPRTRGRKK